ncbi:LSU ribosomal protein L29p [Fibrobacteres bacterium R8-0-B4]
MVTANEIRELSPEEIVKKVDNLEEEFFNLRFQAKMGQLTNPLQLRSIRKDIARAKTILNEKKRAAAKG